MSSVTNASVSSIQRILLRANPAAACQLADHVIYVQVADGKRAEAIDRLDSFE
jgi:hypothetical protein